MTNAGAFAIADFISKNKTITSLSISMTEILAGMRLPKMELQKLRKPSNPIRPLKLSVAFLLDLSHNEISIGGAQLMANALAQNKSLTSLSSFALFRPQFVFDPR